MAVVGTARVRRNWPPSKMEMNDDTCLNDLFYCFDDYQTLVRRWIDNNKLLLVSTTHRPEEFIERQRVRKRLTETNRKHVEQVWGSLHRKNISIPLVVDDCNRSMNGVEVPDQRISYYAPHIRSQRIWLPIFLNCLSVIRNNAFVIHKELSTGAVLSQKDFMMGFIDSFMVRSRLH